MNDTDTTQTAGRGKKLYVQLVPDESSREALVNVQSQLPIPRSGRMLPADELHVTIIHFGKVDEVYADLHGAFGVSRETYDLALDRLITELEPLVTDEKFTLVPRGFDGLGKNGHTLVIRYDAPDVLYAIHARALVSLRRFFTDCNVADVDTFMKNDANFRYALTLTPHATLYKGYDGPLPVTDLQPITMTMMKIVY